MHQLDTLLQAVIFHVHGRHFQSVQADVHRVNLRRRIMRRHLDGQAAAAGAQIQRAVHQLGIFDPRRQRLAQKFVNKRTRHNHALIDIKIEIALPRVLRDIGNRHALFDAFAQFAQQFGFFIGQQRRVQIRFQHIQRQMQRVQDQIGGFVVGVVAAVSEHQPSLLKTAHGKTQEIAQRVQAAFGLAEQCV